MPHRVTREENDLAYHPVCFADLSRVDIADPEQDEPGTREILPVIAS